MYDTKENKHIFIRENVSNCQQSRQSIHLKEKKKVSWNTKSKLFAEKKLLLQM